MKLKPNKLCIVAHPDDEVLWGGANILLESGWKLIVATNKNHKKRSLECKRTAVLSGIWEVSMYNCKDEFDDDKDYISNCYLDKVLKKLSKQKWDLVLTHNKDGEYGHIQHKQVHHLVKKHFPNAKTFQYTNKKLNKTLLENKRLVHKLYADTQNIAYKIFNNNAKLLTKIERSHYEKEKLYVKSKTKQIPKIIHQMWIGGRIPSFKKYFMDSIKDWCAKNDFTYILWDNKMLNEDMLPNVWKWIEKSKKYGKKYDLNKWAQISDLARYELLCRYGGYYLDTNFEMIGDFNKVHNKMNKDNVRFVGANEDPCGLSCVGKKGMKYLSNGFFGCVVGSEVMLNCLDQDNLSKINMRSKFVNQETGPYYLRKNITNPQKYKVKLLKTNEIYPFVKHDSDYRKGKDNKCVNIEKTKDHTKKIKYKKSVLYLENPCKKYESILMNHFLGGTWIKK